LISFVLNSHQILVVYEYEHSFEELAQLEVFLFSFLFSSSLFGEIIIDIKESKTKLKSYETKNYVHYNNIEYQFKTIY